MTLRRHKAAAASSPSFARALNYEYTDGVDYRGLTALTSLSMAVSAGNFFEANLLKGLQGLNRPTPNSDFKAPLLQLLDLLRTVSSSKSLPPSSDKLPLSSELTLPGSAPQAPARFAPSLPLGDTLRMLADLLKQVEGSLARIQLNQLTSTPHQATEAETRPAWLIELPLRNGERIDLVQMKFEEERGKNSDGNAEKQWSVKLAFDLDTIGPLHIKVTYAGGSISTIFWAEQHDSAELFKANMGELEQRLTKAGLVVNKLDTHSGAPPFKNGLLAAESILDEKA
ncbi:flagellar hook-length control protein FliK [Candidatus Reidiella endopervernicosa]|uniref:Flagellar hook-length control protein FliK n=1 Tax=Candidatus Reidiella endopervernicosa TaxID=2738883 RepID=A0A6N0HYC4_9GAMM|nr:flagellar hook-length control protein FliK [Candidatus Reidiella endopervernicosa]QKQ27287.1 flagellar hook-length control protein FliK [Candidatus Reidiella endopervernicosa]